MEGNEDVERAEEERRQRVEPEAADERTIVERARDRAGPPHLAWRRVDGCDCRGEAGRDDRDRAEGRADADEVGDAAEHRADDEPEHREPEHRAEGLTAPSTGDADRRPGERARPRRRAGQPLREACDAERDRATGEREGEAREGKHDQAQEDAALRSDAADEPPGIPPTSAPPPYAPSRSPASSFVRS